ncbi:MAG: RIO1 family regulatory kinase/ATPase [Candidatus Micrarchaeota archaeon]
MAMKLSTKKRPDREVKMIKEGQTKFSERVFDDVTIRTLKELMIKGVFSSLDFPIAHGKEAAVYRATKDAADGGEKEYLAVKIFKFEGPSFQKRAQYLEGDKRFNMPGNKREMVRIFAKKEFANLKLVNKAGVRAPRPVKCKDNVVVMEFLGEEGVPSELLIEAEILDPMGTVLKILENMRRMHEAGIVHVDLSEYNIINFHDEPYIIDVGQAVLTHHPQASQFLRNDIHNLLKFFRKIGAGISEEIALEYIKGEIDAIS